MPRSNSIFLVVIGAFLILGPTVVHAIRNDREKARVAEFYNRTGSNPASLPVSLQPSEMEGYDWACFGIGTLFATTGLRLMIGKSGCDQSKPMVQADPLA